MIDIKRKNKYEEKLPNNSQEILNQKNIQKLSLRKKHNFVEIQKKRNYNLAHIKSELNSNIKPELHFKINKFEQSYNLIISYLNSNNKDLINYCINEINIFFMYNCPNENEQKIFSDNNLFNLLFIIGNSFINNKDAYNLEKLLTILINIQFFEKGTHKYCDILYSKEYFEFYNKCFLFSKEFGILNLIISIIKLLIDNNNYFNIEILRSNTFTSILDIISKENEISQEDKELIVYIINYTVDLSNLDELLKEKDKLIIYRALRILINELYGTKNDKLLVLIYEGLFNLSNFGDKNKFNKIMINEGVIIKIMKIKLNKIIIDANNTRIIEYAVRILANCLTLSDKLCQIIYDQNIIDYYNNILNKFENNDKIIKAVFTGLGNISVGKNKDVIISSNIWEEKNIQKFNNISDEIKLSYIKIVKYYIYNSDYQKLKFIFKTQILHYFLYLLTSSNNCDIIIINILKIIDHYLSRFNKELKKTQEYLIIFNKFYDLFQSSDILYKSHSFNDINSIVNHIKNNYN